MSINNCVFSGNLGKDCETRVTPNGKTIASFSLPVKQGWGENEKVSWVTCKLFGAKAEKLPQYLLKGIKVTVVGEFVLEEWEKDGQQNKMPVIIVNSLDFGGNAQGGGQGGGQQSPQQHQQQAPQYQAPPQHQQMQQPASQPAPAYAPQQAPAPQPQQQQQQQACANDFDDIPF